MFTEEQKRIIRGTCSTCKVFSPDTVKVRMPDLEDLEEAKKMRYFSCDACFKAVWAGEN